MENHIHENISFMALRLFISDDYVRVPTRINNICTYTNTYRNERK